MTGSDRLVAKAPDDGSPLWSWAPWGLAVVVLALGLSAWHPFPPGIWHDDGVYVLLGRSLAEGDGLRYVGLPGAPLAPKFPPLFPVLLAIVWTLFPNFPENVPFLGGLNLVLTAVAAGLFCLYCMRIMGIRASLAVALTGFIWMSAHLWRVAYVPLSEPTFLLGFVAAIWAGGRMEAKPGPGPVVLFLLMAGWALFARTLGVAILAAGVIALLLSGRKKAALGAGLGSIALYLPWWFWTRRATATVPEYLMDTLGPYSGWLTDQILQGPGAFAGFMAKNAGHLLSRVGTLLLPGVTGPFLLVGLVLAPVLFLGCWGLFLRSRLAALALLLSMGILVVWPFQDVRLLVPFQPVLVLCMALGFQRLLQAERLKGLLRGGVGGAAFVWGALFVAVSLFRMGTGWPGEAYEVRSAALIDAVRAVSDNTPDGAVVGAPELWSGIHLYTGRTVTPSARFRPLSGGQPVEGTPEQQYEIWIGTGLTHIMVEHGGQVHGEALDRVDALCAPGTVQLLDSQPGRFLVSLSWGDTCKDLVRETGPDL